MKNLIQETLFIYFVSVWGAQNPKKKNIDEEIKIYEK